MKDTLTKSQKEALELVRSGSNVCITGGAGVGKSFITQVVIDELKVQGKTVMVVAPTGKAATVINGVTAHRAFGIPIRMTWKAVPNISEACPVYHTDVVIIDEISMLRIDAFEYIWKSIDKVNEIRRFGDATNGKTNQIQLIVVGDFLQLCPVIIDPADGSLGEREIMSEYYGFDITFGYAYKAPGWKDAKFRFCELQEVVRQSNKKDVDILNGIRCGEVVKLHELKSAVRKRKFGKGSSVVRLVGTNKMADTINSEELSKINSECRAYKAKSSGIISASDKPAPEIVRLKKGARVIMIQNGPEYVNGSTGAVVDMDPLGVTVKLDDSGKEIYISEVEWSIEKYVVLEKNGKKYMDKEVVGTYRQIPLKLAYAITIHKSQGQTINKAELILGGKYPQIFAVGQMYVAVSRVKKLSNLYIDGDPESVSILAAQEVLDFYDDLRGSK